MSEQNSYSELFFDKRLVLRPTPKTWIKHILLLLVTFLTCTVVGTIYPFGIYPFFASLDPQSTSEFLQIFPQIPLIYLRDLFHLCYLILTDWTYTSYGLSFSVSILFILICHEMGHYVACRIYGVDATLPYFIPTPPMIGPAGTLGAFIKILSPMPSRKAVFDIGVAGPIAGFVAILPVAALAVLTTKPAPPLSAEAEAYQVIFSDPLLYRIFAFFGGIDLNQPFFSNPFYFAAWLGLLVTALNLIPSGQLDGGHAIYAIFGEKIHRLTGKIVFAVMAVFSVAGFYFYSSPSGFLFVIILAVMMRVGHPPPLDPSPLDAKRKVIAVFVLIMFILCFVPFPIRLN